MLGAMEPRKASREGTNGGAPFNAQAFLESAGVSKTIVEYGRNETIFTQGDACEDVLYIKTGGVKLSVLSKTGREAVVAMLGPGDFFGEGCLAGQPVRMGSATAITPSVILLVAKEKMVRLLHKQHAMSDRFIAHMLARNIRIEEDLIDQPLRQAGQAGPRGAEGFPGHAGGDDRHDALARELLSEQIQEARLHRVRRGAAAQDQQLALERRAARLSA